MPHVGIVALPSAAPGALLMKPIRSLLAKVIAPPTPPASAWRISPAAPVPRRSSSRVAARHRGEPTPFQRCLAVHLHFAAPRGGLS
jgi:hypothetical protein